jgi:uncharacterized protein (DUF1697 family)
LPERYVAFLRGINVGRANRVAMADLRLLVAGLGGTGVQTLLNSGNILFDAPGTDAAALSARIEQALDGRLHVSTPVIVLRAAQLAAVMDENPLLGIATDPTRLLVSLRMRPADPRPLQPLLQQDWSPEALAPGAHATYLWCPEGVIKSRLVQALTRQPGDRLTTTRNWATVLKLHALAQADQD